MLGVLVYIHVFRGWTLTCHSRLLRLVLFIFSLATFCIHVYVFFLVSFSCFSSSSFCPLFGLIRLSPPVTHQYGYTPLHLACDEGHLEVARALMDNGADLGAKNNVSPYALPPYSHPGCCWDVFFWMCFVFVWLLVVPVVR